MHRILEGVAFTDVQILNGDDQPTSAPLSFNPLMIQVQFDILTDPPPPLILTVGVDTYDGLDLTRISSEEISPQELQPGKNCVFLKTEFPFTAGLYNLILRADLAYPNNRTLAQVKPAMTFELRDSNHSPWQLRNKSKHLVPLKGEWSIGPQKITSLGR